MKRVPCDPTNPQTTSEIDLLKQLNSLYIVRYHDSYIEKSWLCIVMDYCIQGDLKKQLVKCVEEKIYFSESQILTWFT